MWLNVLCNKCSQERAESPEAQAEIPYRRYAVEFADGLVMRFNCDRGHSQTFILHALKYEVLVQFALLAWTDGYYRECVSGMYTALERFLETLTLAYEIHAGVEIDKFDDAWRSLKAQSERQLGAFLMLHLSVFKSSCSWLKLNAWSELRNNATHRGYIPTKSEARGFASEILVAMAQGHADLRYLDRDLPARVSLANSAKTRKALNDEPADVYAFQTAVSMFWQPSSATFEDAILTVQRFRDVFGPVEGA